MKRILLALLAVAIAAVFAPRAHAEEDVVRYGSLRIPTPVMVAAEKGYFKDQNIKFEIVFYKSGAEIAPAVATGQVEAAGTTSGAPLFNALTRGLPVKIVADALQLVPDAPGGDPTSIVVRSQLIKSGEVKSAKDLAGRKIAVTAPGQVLDMIARQYMENAGVPADKYQIVAMPLPDMIVAMESGAIDAAVMIDPFPLIAEQRGVASTLAKGSKELPGLQQAFIIFGKEMTEKKRDVAQRFINAYGKATTWMREAVKTPEGRAEVAEIYQKWVPAKSAKFYEQTSQSTASADLSVNVSGKFGLDWQVKELKERGLLKGDLVIADHVDEEFAKTFAKTLKK